MVCLSISVLTAPFTKQNSVEWGSVRKGCVWVCVCGVSVCECVSVWGCVWMWECVCYVRVWIVSVICECRLCVCKCVSVLSVWGCDGMCECGVCVCQFVCDVSCESVCEFMCDVSELCVMCVSCMWCVCVVCVNCVSMWYVCVRVVSVCVCIVQLLPQDVTEANHKAGIKSVVTMPNKASEWSQKPLGGSFQISVDRRVWSPRDALTQLRELRACEKQDRVPSLHARPLSLSPPPLLSFSHTPLSFLFCPRVPLNTLEPGEGAIFSLGQTSLHSRGTFFPGAREQGSVCGAR